jgi:hypothetical protein
MFIHDSYGLHCSDDHGVSTNSTNDSYGLYYVRHIRILTTWEKRKKSTDLGLRNVSRWCVCCEGMMSVRSLCWDFPGGVKCPGV